MSFYLPIFISMFLFIFQGQFGLMYRLRETLITASIYTAMYAGYFINHEIVVIMYVFLMMFWGIAIATFLQRNSWRRFMKKGELEYEYEG